MPQLYGAAIKEISLPIINNNSKPISPFEADEALHKLETDYDLFQWQLEGWCVWPLFRFGIGMSMQRFEGTAAVKRLSRLQTYELLVRDMAAELFIRKAKFFCKTYASSRMEQENGLWKDVFFDDWIKETGDCFKIEDVNNKTFYQLSKKAFVRSNMSTCLFGEKISHELKKYISPRNLKNAAVQIDRVFKKIPHLQRCSSESIENTLRKFVCAKKIYRKLLEKVKPEYVAVADPGEYEVVAAAKELGIKTVEFQHGSLYRCHYAYSWRFKHAGYRDRMPISQYFFVYGKYWKEELLAHGFWGQEVRVVGSPRIDKYRKVSRGIGPENLFTILFTSQGVAKEKVEKFFSEFFEIVPKQFELRLLIKLHPVYDDDANSYSVLKRNTKVKIIPAFERPGTLDILASQTSLHVSLSSTCHYDAISIGIPTVILPFYATEEVQHLHQKGQAFLAHTPHELAEIVMRGDEMRKPSIFDYHFPGAVKNIQTEMSCC